jgi:hypothetical protein
VRQLGNASRVAIWFICMPKIPILVYFGRPWNGKCSLEWKMFVYLFYIWSFGTFYLLPFGIFYGRLVYFVAIWNICPNFGMFCDDKSGNPERKGTRVALSGA